MADPTGSETTVVPRSTPIHCSSKLSTTSSRLSRRCQRHGTGLLPKIPTLGNRPPANSLQSWPIQPTARPPLSSLKHPIHHHPGSARPIPVPAVPVDVSDMELVSLPKIPTLGTGPARRIHPVEADPTGGEATVHRTPIHCSSGLSTTSSWLPSPSMSATWNWSPAEDSNRHCPRPANSPSHGRSNRQRAPLSLRRPG